ncbi:TPA: hypothetical protein ACH3X2_013164 [Trebouxia sp. C0005]
MQVDAVGESSHVQRHAHISAPTHAASSDDCSAVNLPSSTSAQDGATSLSAQHAQHATAQDSSAHYQVPADNPSMSSPSHRSSFRTFRKRKQPDQSLPPPLQAQPEGIISQLDNTSGAEKSILHGKPQKVTKPDSLASQLSCRKGKRKASGRKTKPRSKYEALIGRTVDVPAPIFSVDIPDLYYRGTVLKKDPAHPGSVVVRFIEDGSRYWFPLAEVEQFLEDMQSKGRDAASGTIGQGSHAFAAQVLAGTLAAKKASGMTSSSATAGSHEVEVSSDVNSRKRIARSPSRLSRKAATSNADGESSSLQTLAAAADSGNV